MTEPGHKTVNADGSQASPASALQRATYNNAEMALAQAIGLQCVRKGPNVDMIGQAIAAYRERLIKRLERVRGNEQSIAEAVKDIRKGYL